MRNIIFIIGLFLTFSYIAPFKSNAASISKKKKNVPQDSIAVSVNYLKFLLDGNDGWKPQNKELEKNLRGLVHFIEDDEIDTVLNKINQYQKDEVTKYFYRPSNRVSDSLMISGYVSQLMLNEQLMRIDREVRNSIVREEIPVPEKLLANMDQKVRLLNKDEANLLLIDSLVVLPDSLLSFDVVPDSKMLSAADFIRIQRLDSLKRSILENARLQYNNNVLQYYIDSVSSAYRDKYVQQVSEREKEDHAKLIRNRNFEILQQYNDSVETVVNSNLFNFVNVLSRYAAADSTLIWVHNSDQDSTQIWLRNNDNHLQRMFIKNEQNDSLGIRIQNLDKNSMKILIEDGVTFSRFSQKQSKEFRFDELLPEKGLRKVVKRYDVRTPWTMGGDGTVGFSQTYLNNWKKGGESALSTLLVLKGFANYSADKVKWENNVELRNGWLKPGGGGIQKNDDKFEIISRFGVSAFKKWYYSAEVDFETQFFNGYDYPDRDNVISGYMAPGKTLIKFGLDYKPNKNFSLFLSPFTSKTVYVRDTVKVDASKFGVEPGKKRYWEPGLNADVKFKKEISPTMTYEMKYKMFINYSAPFSKFDVNWENNFVMRLTDFINMRVMLHLIYDDNVKFPIFAEQDGVQVEIGKEPKWQVKEFLTIGFSYKLNKSISRRKRLN